MTEQTNTCLTPEQVKQKFKDNGWSYVDWAKANKFKVRDVYRLLNNQAKGMRGAQHELAVALGLKPAGADALLSPLNPRLQQTGDNHDAV